ncbi:MAG: GIY-YIG nuclease family protein [Cyclobacteriaceae bacterium]|nr:GIY-YIG nuclease family protein [Cyclobacteriaceae bacterium SS2]
MVRGGLVYITTTRKNTVLYTGVSSDLPGRVYDHKTKAFPKSFTARYNVDKLVFYEEHPSIEEAIAREKEIKGWTRAKKIKLIEFMNPEWRDLYEDVMEW